MNKKQQAETTKLLALLFEAFNTQSAGADIDLRAEAYLFAVDEYEFEDVSDAIRHIIRGHEGHERRAFAPSTAELCTEVRRQKEIRRLVTANNLREIGKSNRFVAIEGGAA